MAEWAGLVPTGRRIAGPAADLFELDDGADGLKHTAVAFHERYRSHPALHRGIELIQNFLEFPMVAGLVELKHWIAAEGAFIYPTGTTWTATEVIRVHRDTNTTLGTRGALEMLFLAGMIVHEASETGPKEGVFSHGSLSPQRVLFKADGQVQIIGYGLPQVELMMLQEDPSFTPNEDAYRYCPPERFEGSPENGDADLFALALIAYELMTNEPVYDGSYDQLKKLAETGTAAKRIEKSKHKIAGPIKDLLSRMAAFDPGERPVAIDFVSEVETLLSGLQSDSPPLTDVMENVRQASARRGRSLAVVGSGEAVSSRGVPVRRAEPIQARPGPIGGITVHTFSSPAAAAGSTPDRAAATPSTPGPTEDKRWGKSARGRADEAEAPAAAAVATPAVEDARDRLRERLRRNAGTEASSTAAPAEDPREKLRARLRGAKDGEAAEPTPVAAAPASPAAPDKVDDARERLRARLRQSSGAAETPPEPTPPAPEAPKAAPEPPKPAEPQPATAAEAAPAPDPKQALRDRLRRGKDDDHKQPAAEPAPPEPAKAEPPPAQSADPRAALRDRLRKGRDEAAAAPAVPEQAAVAAPPAPADDPRAALKARLKQRKE